MVVTVDGPAGVGKSTVARRLAERLNFEFLDTGAMYRMAALAAAEQQVEWQDRARLEALVTGLQMSFHSDRVWLNGRDVTEEIRRSQVGGVIHHVADNPRIRAHLVELQREFARGKNVVAEGRDQGTVAFPQAECKIFLNASPRERARRRWVDLMAKGEPLELETVLAQQNERDQRDATRSVGRLYKAPDAVEVLTDGLTLEQVVDRLEELARSKLAG